MKMLMNNSFNVLTILEFPKAPKLKLSRQIIDGQETWDDRQFYCSGELGPEGTLTIEWTINGTFVPLLSDNDTDNDVAFIKVDRIDHQTSTCNNEVAIPFAFKTAYVNSELHGKRLRCKTSPSAGLGLDVLYSNEEEIKVINSSFCKERDDGYYNHPFHCNLYIQCYSTNIAGMHECQDRNCWDASDGVCKQCDQLVVGCQGEVTTTTPDPTLEQINCLPLQISVLNDTRPNDVYCSLVNVEQINILNITKNGNLLQSIHSPSGIHTFGDFISASVATGAINVTFGTAFCEDEGKYLIELNNDTRAEFSLRVVSNAEIPILNITSRPKLNQILKLTCAAILGRGPGGRERTQVVLQRRKNSAPFEEYGTTHMSDCSTSPCVCFVEAEYLVLLTDSWNETDVRCALKNTSTNVIEEDLTSSESRIILGDTEIYFTDVNKTATVGTPVELICKLQNGQGDQGVKITRTSDNLNCAVDSNMNQIHCDVGYSVSSDMSGDLQVVIITIESMSCIDESEYHCTAVKDSSSYASLRLMAQADPKEPILFMPMTTVENIPTPYTQVDNLWCIANIGSDTNRVVQIEIQRSSESEFSVFNLKTAEPLDTTPGNCEINVTITYKGIKFDNSYNNSKIRCSVYQNSSSTEPMVSSPMYNVTLLPESICNEVTNTELVLRYPFSYLGSCRKYVRCLASGLIYVRECGSTLCPVITNNGTTYVCDYGCSSC
ncbi:uncharacterized protein LOC128218934 [Mya arenaria]|uniref:uncharacterized protein LOC128218934 n=1 Tax=Mya arenaria TaxID=6604 RepID=UPI0022E08D79|nr:uncharacterized protein LOC128218934 [Mya arenaria]